MSKVFEAYAKYYDLLYQDKDYDEECNIIEQLLQRHCQRKVTAVLDAACGTGGHAIRLAKRGYQVIGFDASEHMIEQAKSKDDKVRFHVMDLRKFDIGRKFDACICMFAAMNYVTTNSEIRITLSNIRRHLRANGIFIFDFWNGLAVLRILPESRSKIVTGDEKIRIVRFVKPELDAFHHLCKSHYHLIVTRGNRIIEEVRETHYVRYFFPQEITHYLEDASFEVLQISPFPSLEGHVDETTWNAIAVARAR